MTPNADTIDRLLAEVKEEFKHLYRECAHGIQIEKCKFCSYKGQKLSCKHNIQKRNCSRCSGVRIAVNLFDRAKHRAKKKGMEFSLTKSDVEQKLRDTKAICPVLGIELRSGGFGTGLNKNAPTLDRIDNTKGYTFENTIVISWRANVLKSDATFDELKKIAAFYKKYNLDIVE